MHHLIGFGLIIVGGVLTAVTDQYLFTPILLVGVFLFASIFGKDALIDYMYPGEENVALVRMRQYVYFLPFVIVTAILTLGRAPLQIPYKETYYRVKDPGGDQEAEFTQLTRKEYLAQRNWLRQEYASGRLDRAFFERAYGENAANIGYRRKKWRLVAMWILAVLMLTPLTEPQPGLVALVLLYELLFVGAIVLWTADYKDAKIQQTAYDRAVQGGGTDGAHR